MKPLLHIREGARVAKRASEFFLNARISENNHSIRLSFQHQQLESAVSKERCVIILETLTEKCARERVKCKLRQKGKIDRLE